MYDIKKTGEIIKKLRTQKGKTQERVADEMGINIKTYRAIENGSRGGSVDTLYLIAQYFNVAIDYLICGEVTVMIDKLLINLDTEKREQILKILKELVSLVRE